MPDGTQHNLTAITAVDEAHSFAEYDAIKAALQIYIDSAKPGDGALARSAFFDHAHIVGSVEGTYYEMDPEAFGEAVSAGGAAPDVKSHIAWINVSGPAAAASVEFLNWGGMRYTDFFVLYKKDGTWKISSKVYDSHAKN
ncbi:MAG: nuclear transport factor 2 family protein [Paracoccaceae bacterium]